MTKTVSALSTVAESLIRLPLIITVNLCLPFASHTAARPLNGTMPSSP